MILNQDNSHIETESDPFDNAASALPPSVTSRKRSPHSGTPELLDNPVPMAADADISQIRISRCPSPLSPLSALTPSPSPSSPIGGAQDLSILLRIPARDTCDSRNSVQYSLELDPSHEYDISDRNLMEVQQSYGPSGSKTREIDDGNGETNTSAGGHKPKIFDMDYESSVEASKSPTSSHRRMTAGIGRETESGGSESDSKVNEEPPRRRKRKIVDIESESESEDNEGPHGNHGGSHDEDESGSEPDATVNNQGTLISADFVVVLTDYTVQSRKRP